MIIKKYLAEILICVNILLNISLCTISVYCFFFKNEVKQDDTFIKEVYEEEKKTIKYFIDIKGAVLNPGVYELDSNSIVNDVILLAGGFADNAYTLNINLSKKISDGMVIYVYTKYEYTNIQKYNDKQTESSKVCSCPKVDIKECLNTGSSTIESKNEGNNINNDVSSEIISNETSKENNIININSANEDELTTLTGIGSAKAKNIINYRNENGPFLSIEDIKNVTGISEKIYEGIKDNITV